MKPPASPHDGPPARAISGCLQLASIAASPVRRFRRRKRPSAPRPYAPVNRGQRTGPPGLPRTSRLGWASGAYGGAMRPVCVHEPARWQRIYILMMPGSVRHNNSMNRRLRARRAVVLAMYCSAARLRVMLGPLFGPLIWGAIFSQSRIR